MKNLRYFIAAFAAIAVMPWAGIHAQTNPVIGDQPILQGASTVTLNDPEYDGDNDASLSLGWSGDELPPDGYLEFTVDDNDDGNGNPVVEFLDQGYNVLDFSNGNDKDFEPPWDDFDPNQNNNMVVYYVRGLAVGTAHVTLTYYDSSGSPVSEADSIIQVNYPQLPSLLIENGDDDLANNFYVNVAAKDTTSLTFDYSGGECASYEIVSAWLEYNDPDNGTVEAEIRDEDGTLIATDDYNYGWTWAGNNFQNGCPLCYEITGSAAGSNVGDTITLHIALYCSEDDYDNDNAATETTATIAVYKGDILVDANHDSVIDDDDSGIVSSLYPFRHWLNDEKDINTGQPYYSNDYVDGADDLKGFTPVFLDIQSLVNAFPDTAVFKLKQADEAVNFIYTDLTEDEAFSCVDGADFGPDFDDYATEAEIEHVTAGGVQLSDDFLNNIYDYNGGVIYVEGCAASLEPLVLEVDVDGKSVAEISLSLSLGQDIVLLLHGMNSNIVTWNSFVKQVFGTSPYASASIINGDIPMTHLPDRNADGIRCYRLQFGRALDDGSSREGLEDLTASNAQGELVDHLVPYLSNTLVTCGDFESFDELGQEVAEGVDRLLNLDANSWNNHIVLVGHSRGGIAARVFLQDPADYSDEQQAVVACLITSSPQQGSPMGRIWDYLNLPAHRRTVYDSSGHQVTVLWCPPGSVIGYIRPVNWVDWAAVDFLMQITTPLGDPKPFLDIRRPVIMDMADNSDAITSLNDSTQVGFLPWVISYGEIVYQKADFGLLADGLTDDNGVLNVQGTSPTLTGSYSVFGGRVGGGGVAAAYACPTLSSDTETFITGGRSLNDSSLIGDGLIPAAMQYFTDLQGFNGSAIVPLTNTWDLSVHTDAPNRIDDLLDQLFLLVPDWFP